MSRKTELTTVADWENIVATEELDLQDELMAELNQWMVGPCVLYTTDSTGRIDSESDPAYVDPYRRNFRTGEYLGPTTSLEVGEDEIVSFNPIAVERAEVQQPNAQPKFQGGDQAVIAGNSHGFFLFTPAEAADPGLINDGSELFDAEIVAVGDGCYVATADGLGVVTFDANGFAEQVGNENLCPAVLDVVVD